MEEKDAVIVEEKITRTEPKKKKSSFGKYVIIILTAIAVGAVLMYLFITNVMPQFLTQTIVNKMEKEVTITDAGIADAVDKLYDAVVVVKVYRNEQLTSSGTGFVYKKSGDKAYILTNNHVVSSSYKVTVKVLFTNGNEEEVKIEGSEEYSDLAVLSLDASKVEAVAEIGKSEETRLGDTVFTVGAPLDTEYYWTVTRGILSGKGRMVEAKGTTSSNSYVMKVLQTDASINSGNSGGPLANSNGEVIGITNMKLVSSGVEGIGFAIPIEDAIEYADAIISGEKVQKPLLGVSMLNLTERYRLYQQGITLNTELKTGVVVVEVKAGSPAAEAGLKRGDIVTALGDNATKDSASLLYYLYKYKLGETTTITYERNGKLETAKISLNVANEN